MSSTPQHRLEYPHDRMLRLWEEGIHSDVIVRSQDAEYRLHKAILCEKSEFFFTALNGKWKESKEGVVEMIHHKPSTVKAMLKFMYLGEYDIHEVDVPFADQLRDHADIHAAGIMYNVAGLPDNAARNFDYVFGHGDERERIAAVVDIIPVLCETIPPAVDSRLVADVSDFIADNLGVLLPEDSFKDVMSRFGCFGIEVFARVRAKLSEQATALVNFDVSWEVDENPSTPGQEGAKGW